MLTREKVLETVQALPMEFSLDELVERLILLEKIQIGQLQEEIRETENRLKAIREA